MLLWESNCSIDHVSITHEPFSVCSPEQHLIARSYVCTCFHTVHWYTCSFWHLGCKPVFKITALQQNYKENMQLEEVSFSSQLRVRALWLKWTVDSPVVLRLLTQWKRMNLSGLGKVPGTRDEVRKLSRRKRKQIPREREFWGCRMLNSVLSAC